MLVLFLLAFLLELLIFMGEPLIVSLCATNSDFTFMLVGIFYFVHSDDDLTIALAFFPALIGNLLLQLHLWFYFTNMIKMFRHFCRLRKDFKHMLEEMGCVTPGKSLNELRVLFLGRECFENLPEQDIQEIYDLHQRELIQRSKKNFQELLLERADLFYQFRSSPMATVTQNDILDITEALQEDSRSVSICRDDLTKL